MSRWTSPTAYLADPPKLAERLSRAVLADWERAIEQPPSEGGVTKRLRTLAATHDVSPLLYAWINADSFHAAHHAAELIIAEHAGLLGHRDSRWNQVTQENRTTITNWLLAGDTEFWLAANGALAHIEVCDRIATAVEILDRYRSPLPVRP